ncbi:MAG: hypothetical protein IPL47_10420 [Phyllobacteriaceae bacterium]|nr:hypothetical protein [Phyllobacteriaceae bacterium]
MSKYDPLRDYLAGQTRERIAMTFTEIETVLGFALPASKANRAWWSNNPHNNVMTRAWLAAGFETEAVDTEGECLTFRRTGLAPAISGYSEDRQPPYSAIGRQSRVNAKPAGREVESAGTRRSIFGCMKGTLTLDPDVDLTQPADPELADYLDRKYGAEDFA